MYEFVTRITITLLFVLLVYTLFFLGSTIRNSLKSYDSIGQEVLGQRTISLEAIGTAEVLPNIAETTMGIQSEAPTVAQAQEKNTRITNVLLRSLMEKGIAKDDIQTEQYTVYPVYDYTREEGRVLRGYEARQRVRIKIRDLDNTKHILALAGQVGVTSVGEISFTVDDTAVYLEEARTAALKNMAKKVLHIEESLGVVVDSVTAYEEFEYGNYPNPIFRTKAAGMEEFDAIGGSFPPTVEPGMSEVRLTVRATFSIQ